MTLDETNLTIDYLKEMQESYIEGEGYERHPLPEWYALDKAIKALEQQPKIKVLDRDEVIRKLGAVDIYEAEAWLTLLKDLEYLELKICEVEE